MRRRYEGHPDEVDRRDQIPRLARHVVGVPGVHAPRPADTALVEPEDGEAALNQRQRVPPILFHIDPPGPMREDDDRRPLDTFRQVEGVVKSDAAALEVPSLGRLGERRER